MNIKPKNGYLDLKTIRSLVELNCPCQCHDSYTSRYLQDPTCPWHNYGKAIIEDVVQTIEENANG